MKPSKKKKKYTFKTKTRMFIFFLLFGVIIFGLGYRLINSLCHIHDLKNEKIELTNELNSLIEEKDVLESDIKRLSDSDYIAKYVREKYFYSRKGEIILRIYEKDTEN